MGHRVAAGTRWGHSIHLVQKQDGGRLPPRCTVQQQQGGASAGQLTPLASFGCSLVQF
jgi:hypothetical protein